MARVNPLQRARYAPVLQRHDRILVLASGPSGAGPWPRHPGVPVIAVNGAIDTLSWAPDYWITLDPAPVNRARFEQPRAGTTYFVAVDPDHGPHARRDNMRGDFSAPHLHLLLRERGLDPAIDPRVINIGNSGRAAVQLALHMRATRIGVLGVDATTDPYWYDQGRGSGSLAGLPDLVRRLKRPGVEIVFGDCAGSRIVAQWRRPPAEVLAWLQERGTASHASQFVLSWQRRGGLGDG